MKIFLSYKFTGVDPEVLRTNISQISAAIKTTGHQAWNSFDSEDDYQAQKFDNRQIMQHALQNLAQSDLLFAFINSPEKSEGMLLEIGYAFAQKKPFILAIQKDLPANATTSLRFMAAKVLEFSDIADLCAQISTGAITEGATNAS